MVSFVKIIFIGLLITILQSANSQTYNYVTYTTREGLAGNMVYDMIQDETGFIWFGTDNGLSRFDGKNFKNYTVNDGLMDNEVLFFHKDFSGRLWMATFSHDLSYRKGNRFYTKYNDTMIARIKPEGRVVSFREGPDSTLWIFCQAQVFCWPKGGVLHEKKFKPAIQQRILNGITHPVIQWIGNYPCISFNDSLFYIQDDSLVFISGFKYQTGVKEITYKGKSGEPQKYSFPNDIVRVTTRNGLPHFVSTVKGAFEMNYNEYNPTPVEHFLPDKGVTSAFMDLEGNYWFSTLGDGVYKLVTKSALTYSISKDINALNEVFSIGKRNDSILTGHGGSRLAIWKSGKLQQVITYEKFLPYFENSIATNRLKSILPLENGAWLLGFDGFLLWQRGKEQKFLPMKAIKTMELQKDHTVLIASGQDVIKVDLDNFKIIKTYYNQRATCATAWNGKVFIGTLSGLKVVDGDNVLPYNAEDSILSRRIIGLASNERFMWVATSDAGLVQISSNGKRTLLNERNGLPSDICRTMVLSGNNLWVGTNKGLAHIRLTDPKREVLVYNQSNLLPNNAISSLFADNNEVMVGSPAGFTVFETGKVNTNSICGLELDKIQSSKKSWQEDEVILLTPTDNFLQIDYSGISARAAGQMDYFFMLEGMDNQWQQTKVNVITYSNLPPGNYIFKIFARNIFGISSEVRFFKVSVTAPFWKKWWFVVICFLSGLGIILRIFYFRLQVRNKKIEENNRIQLQLAELEHKALQAQMNPHFIFNSLNSIQQYIVSNNLSNANKYLSIFASLIRETLENSTLGYITIRREVEYLSKYLELEQLRFGMRFSYSIKTGNILNDNNVKIPVMLLQPFVENAVRHGMRYKLDGSGNIEISFHLLDNQLHCYVEDNGPGREKTAALRTYQHIEYQSRGMELTQKRIELLNKIYADKISIFVNDRHDENGNTNGTSVHIVIEQNYE